MAACSDGKRGLTPDSKHSMEEEEFPWPSSEKVNKGLVLVRKGCFPKAQQRGERHFFFKAAMHFLYSPKSQRLIFFPICSRQTVVAACDCYGLVDTCWLQPPINVSLLLKSG